MILDILKSLRRGKNRCKRRRIGSLKSYLRRLADSLKSARMAKGLNVSEAELRAAIKATGEQLTWMDPDCSTPVALWTPGESGGKAKLTGTPAVKDEGEYQLASGSILDFDCVITTARRDRDGDVLDPKGAIVDPKMPLLWQHLPFSPIGRLVRVLEQTDDRVSGRFCVLDTQLGRDAATLIEGGALRISHGFNPIEYSPLKDDNGKDLGGWSVRRYAMMEASAVSIPSNVDAEITAFSRGKLHHPLVKSWCRLLSTCRSKSVKSGWDPLSAARDAALHVHVHLDSGKKAGTAVRHKGRKDAAPPDEDDKEDEEEEDETGKAGEDDGGDEEEEDEDDPDEEDSDDEPKGVLLGDLIDAARELSKDDSLPKEAQRRMGVVDGLMEDIEEAVSGHMDSLGEYAKTRDLAGILGCVAEMTEVCMGRLSSVAEELDRIAGIADLPDGAADRISELASGANQIVEAVGTLTGAAQTDPEAADPDADDDRAGDDDGDEDEDEDEDDPDDDFGKDEDADEDEKAEDDEDDGDENPEAEVDPDEDNPGVPKGRALDRLLGLQMLGHKLTAAQRKGLRLGLKAREKAAGDGKDKGGRPGRSRRRPAR